MLLYLSPMFKMKQLFQFIYFSKIENLRPIMDRGGHFGYFIGSVRVRFGLASSVLVFFQLK